MCPNERPEHYRSEFPDVVPDLKPSNTKYRCKSFALAIYIRMPAWHSIREFYLIRTEPLLPNSVARSRLAAIAPVPHDPIGHWVSAISSVRHCWRICHSSHTAVTCKGTERLGGVNSRTSQIIIMQIIILPNSINSAQMSTAPPLTRF